MATASEHALSEDRFWDFVEKAKEYGFSPYEARNMWNSSFVILPEKDWDTQLTAWRDATSRVRFIGP